VGETQVRKVNVRVISATNRDLEREVNKGSFRGDLYFRIAVVSVRVPSLRERPEDLPFLIRAFLASIGASDKEHLFQPLMEELVNHEWPGNVRELRNYVERSVVLQTAKLSMPPRAPVVASESRGGDSVDVAVPFKVAKEALVDQFERSYIRAALDASGGNMTKAARLAGIDRMYLHRLVQKHGNREPLASSPGEPAPSQRRPPSGEPT
jgi:DNA-binding NtrC family response regulator